MLYTTCAISDGEVGIGKLVGLDATDPAKSTLWSQGGMGGEGELRQDNCRGHSFGRWPLTRPLWNGSGGR